MLAQIKALPNRYLLYALLSADLMYVILHIFYLLPSEIFPFFQDAVFSISKDGGLAESFQYVQELWIALAFFWLVSQRRRYALAGFGLIFCFFLIDDMVKIHENLGEVAGRLFANLPILTRFSHLKADSIGELLVAGGLGLVFLGLLLLPYWRTNHPTRQIFHKMFLLLVIFAFFAVGLDFLDRFFDSRVIQAIIKLAEDGGEMLAMSIICWYAWTLCASFFGKADL